MEETEKRLEKAEKDLADLKELTASQKPVNEIVRYLLYFWLTISVIFGAFGWRQLSDFDEQVREAVAALFPRDSENYARYEQLIEDTNDLRQQFEELTRMYTERMDDLKSYADVLSDDFDIEGQLELLVSEGTDDDNISDREWRTRAILTIRAFSSVLEERAFPGDFVFNVAQLCRKLRQFALVETMANAAYERDASPAIRAMLLSSRASSNGPGRAQEEAYTELIDMVKALDYEADPHIVLAEAWNAAEDTRRYQVLIDALDALVSERNRRDVPAIAYAIKSRALLRRGNPGSREEALEALREGYTVYKDESPLSLWAGTFAAQYMDLSRIIQSQEDINEMLDGIATDGVELDINSYLGSILSGVNPGLDSTLSDVVDFPALTLDDVDRAESIALGQVGQYAFRADGEATWHRVSIQDTGVYRIDAISSNGDPVIAVWSSNGRLEELMKNDDGGSATDARIDIRLEPGIYYLGVRNFSGREGDFTLEVRASGRLN